jgi:hypothetical protein
MKIICCSCKLLKMSDEWVQYNQIFSDNLNIRFSHGICPSCTKKLYGSFLKNYSKNNIY